MEFYEVVNKRRSIRQFEDKEIPREILERILDAGLKAPSSNHQRRWELLTLTDKAVILELAKCIRPYPCRIQEPKSPQQEMFQIAYPRQRSMIEESACVILPYFKQKYPLSEDKNGYGLMDYGAAWALVENMLLAATAEGVGAARSGGAGLPREGRAPAHAGQGDRGEQSPLEQMVKNSGEAQTLWNSTRLSGKGKPAGNGRIERSILKQSKESSRPE